MAMNRSDKGLKNVCLAAITLHIAQRPINKRNIRMLLESAARYIDEEALHMIAHFVDLLNRRKGEAVSEPTSDP